MDMNAFNVSATLNVFRLLTKPTLCLPHATISTFDQLPLPLNTLFRKYKNIDIRAVVLDKDNCFAYPESNEVYKPYQVRWSSFTRTSSLISIFLSLHAFPGDLLLDRAFPHLPFDYCLTVSYVQIQEHFQRLRAAYPGRRLLIVSNTSGAISRDSGGHLALQVEASTSVNVLPHRTKKPGCGSEIMEYFKKYPETGVTSPDQIAVIGDRLTTDIMMANLIGSYGIWVKEGVVGLEKASMVSDSKIQPVRWN